MVKQKKSKDTNPNYTNNWYFLHYMAYTHCGLCKNLHKTLVGEPCFDV